MLAERVGPVYPVKPLTLTLPENTPPGTAVGAPVAVAVAATYALTGADAASFDFDTATGQISTKTGVTYDYETQASYTVTVTATDDAAESDSVEVTIDLVDLPAVSIAALELQDRILMSDGRVQFTMSATPALTGDLTVNRGRYTQERMHGLNLPCTFKATYEFQLTTSGFRWGLSASRRLHRWRAAI